MFKWTLLILGTMCAATASAYFFYFHPFKTDAPLKQPVPKPVTSAVRSLVLELAQPENDIMTFSPTAEISGKTSPDTSVLISTDDQDYLIKSTKDGDFLMKLNLESGVNKINVVTFDKDGDKRSQARTIYYSKEKI